MSSRPPLTPHTLVTLFDQTLLVSSGPWSRVAHDARRYLVRTPDAQLYLFHDLTGERLPIELPSADEDELGRTGAGTASPVVPGSDARHDKTPDKKSESDVGGDGLTAEQSGSGRADVQFRPTNRTSDPVRSTFGTTPVRSTFGTVEPNPAERYEAERDQTDFSVPDDTVNIKQQAPSVSPSSNTHNATAQADSSPVNALPSDGSLADRSLSERSGPAPRPHNRSESDHLQLNVPRPGRPRLGVVAREVTLLPEHWEWLRTQPGGASRTLRSLVDEARQAALIREQQQRAYEAAYRFATAMGPLLPAFEDALLSVYAGDKAQFESLTSAWPEDVRLYLHKLGFGYLA